MPGQGRLGDKASVPLDAHGCPACPHPGIGPAIAGSPSVLVNKRPALRVDDHGIHAACCGTNTWQAKTGSETVFIDGKAAHRQTDQTKHCGGNGQLVEGSPNVIIGDTTTSPAGLPRAVSSGGAALWNGMSSSSGALSSNTSSSGMSLGSPVPSSSAVVSMGRTSSNRSASANGDNVTAAQDSHAPLAAEPGDAAEPGIDLDPATVHARAQADVLRAAAVAHVPFCEECERARTRS